jgi:hypothetical protein
MAFEVFASSGAREGGIFSSDPLLAFRSPPEFGHPEAAHPKDCPSLQKGCLPCGFFPFDVFPMVGSHVPPRITGPGLSCLHSVSHALEALLHPPSAGLVSCRSRPWGFPSGPISTRRAVLPFGSHYPLTVGSEDPPFQGFAPCERPRLSKSTNTRRETATLMGFTSLGVSSFSPGSKTILS